MGGGYCYGRLICIACLVEGGLCMYMDWGSMYIVVVIHVLCYHVGLSNGPLHW